jgi:hypothetical protein
MPATMSSAADRPVMIARHGVFFLIWWIALIWIKVWCSKMRFDNASSHQYITHSPPLMDPSSSW